MVGWGESSMNSESNRDACTPRCCTHELHFVSLHDPGRSFVIPCDEGGHVDLDKLPARLLNTYLGARAMIGRDYTYPTVEPVH